MRIQESEKTTKIQSRSCRIAAALLAAALLIASGIYFWKTERMPYSVCCIGDSITYGTGVANSRETDSYPALLGDLLGEQYTVYNYGVSGSTLMDDTAKPYKDTGYLEAVQAEAPDVIVVMLGSNDSKQQNWQAEEFERQYIALVEKLQEIKSHPKIYIATPPEAFAGEDGRVAYGIDNDVVEHEIRNIVGEVAEETGVNMIDIYSVTENHPEYFTDGVHPNKAGNEILAAAVCAELNEKWWN